MSKQSAIVGFIVVGLVAFLLGRASVKSTVGDSAAGDTAATASKAPAQAAKAPSVPAATGALKLDQRPSKGPKDALVTIVEVSDFQCPFCTRVLPTIKQITETYPDTVRVVWLNQPLPFHNRAAPAAKAAMAAHNQGKFWEMHDLLFANQKQLTDANFDKWAQQLGLDLAKFKKDLASLETNKIVNRDQAIANAIGARGTPAFLVNGKMVTGARPFDAFKTEIDAAIKTAKDQLAKGVSKDKLHAAVVASNKNYVDYLLNGKTPPATPARDANKKKPASPRPVDKTVYKVLVNKADPSFGPADAAVTIVEFSDFECPFCSRALPILKQIKAQYPKDVRVVFKQNPLPFHKNARPATFASLAAHEQGKFWEMHDLLFQNQKQLTRDNFIKWAGELGLNMAKFTAALDDGAKRYGAQVAADQKASAQVNARGTPNFFINGRKITGARPFDDFKKVIDEELPKAQALLKSGVAPGQLYAKIMASGKTFEPLDTQVHSFSANKRPTYGNAKAPITIIEYSDLECPYCSRFAPTLKKVVDMSGGKAKLIFKHFPLSFHKNALPAAKATNAAHRQGKFWEMHDLVFQNQRTLSDDLYVKLAEQLGLDVAKFKKDMDDPSLASAISADQKEGTQAGVRGTPTFFINGRKYQAPDRSAPGIKRVIDEYILKKKS